ncbi:MULTISPECIES: 5-dehydro-4-deoxyglucarate dehydratase [Actinoalloteichus]|uniref:Dihydrodipicolinate synthase/N-acetylneuraminate lyase n=1 Tax=Actinoalloteichus fjordicus TaxID=1612552 RepID=A0AAC9LHA7_9PSEU|nr:MULTISPECIES: 5-dehydro-4-deoxyglucarate dehydratase [Actinoalloteichus]APU16772.1 dihydrodipicolinate synthase/N-acetylneuraminate lyase [Actinoalloteichus fjordicus]APU22837.1 dihydrodipicolinate synthase/N-acetylneuraminate lyase [Actinoalloteichus sp. GBA129-24]
MRLERVLFFPTTPFDADGTVATERLAESLRAGLAHRPGGIFTACGTGELHALTVAEHELVVRTTVAVAGEEPAAAVPVIAGAGGPLPVAIAQARNAARAGADAILLLPPYLVKGPEAGLIAYVRTVAEASPVPVIFYQRANAVLSVAASVTVAGIPGVIGIKDGVGDLDRMHGIVIAVRAAMGPDFLFFNGLPTAELTAAAYRGIGVELYSSAAFAFAPEVASAFQRALAAGSAQVDALLRGFYQPLGRLRDAVPGYAVALVKAGQRLRGFDVGGVRPPLVDLTEAHLEDLRAILATGLDLVDARPRQPE